MAFVFATYTLEVIRKVSGHDDDDEEEEGEEKEAALWSERGRVPCRHADRKGDRALRKSQVWQCLGFSKAYLLTHKNWLFEMKIHTLFDLGCSM